MDINGDEDIRVLKHAFLNSYFQTGLKGSIDEAVIKRATENNLMEVAEKYKIIDEIPFDFSRRRLSVIVSDGEKKQLITKGAVEEILSICTMVDYKGQVSKITKEIKDNIKKIINDNPSSQYQKLLKELTSDEIAEFNELKAQKNSNIYGVWFEESYVRKYPFSTLACDTIGFASNVNGGELGLESQYDDELSGTDGVSYSYVNDNLDVQETTKDAVDGNNIVTTIDYNVQRIIEKHIAAYNEEKPSSATAVLVMNPNNGEVLGMASYPYFDLNNPRSLERS